MLKKLFIKLQQAKNPIQFWRNAGVSIGENCEIYSSVSFGSEPYMITIGNHTRLNANVNFITHDGGVWVLRGKYPEELSDIDLFGKIVVGDNVHIGTGAVILPGVTIGNNCLIGVGAIVTKDVPDNSVAVGIPARVIETIDEYRVKNEKRFLHTKNMSAEEKKEYLLKAYCND